MNFLVTLRFNEIIYCEGKHSCPHGVRHREAEVYQLLRSIVDQFDSIVQGRKDSPPEVWFFALLEKLSDVQEFKFSQLGLTIQAYKEILNDVQKKNQDENALEMIRADYNHKIFDMISLIRIWIKKYENPDISCK